VPACRRGSPAEPADAPRRAPSVPVGGGAPGGDFSPYLSLGVHLFVRGKTGLIAERIRSVLAIFKKLYAAITSRFS